MEPTSKVKERLEAKAHELLQPTDQGEAARRELAHELAALAHDLAGSSDDKTALADWLADKASQLWVSLCVCLRLPKRFPRTFPPPS